jgi:hypothetical protein
MRAAEIVERDVEANGGKVTVNLFAKAVAKAGKPNLRNVLIGQNKNWRNCGRPYFFKPHPPRCSKNYSMIFDTSFAVQIRIVPAIGCYARTGKWANPVAVGAGSTGINGSKNSGSGTKMK